MSNETLDINGIAELLKCSADIAREECARGEWPVFSEGRKGYVAVKEQLLEAMKQRAMKEQLKRLAEQKKKIVGIKIKSMTRPAISDSTNPTPANWRNATSGAGQTTP